MPTIFQVRSSRSIAIKSSWASGSFLKSRSVGSLSVSFSFLELLDLMRLAIQTKIISLTV